MGKCLGRRVTLFQHILVLTPGPRLDPLNLVLFADMMHRTVTVCNSWTVTKGIRIPMNTLRLCCTGLSRCVGGLKPTDVLKIRSLLAVIVPDFHQVTVLNVPKIDKVIIFV